MQRQLWILAIHSAIVDGSSKHFIQRQFEPSRLASFSSTPVFPTLFCPRWTLHQFATKIQNMLCNSSLRTKIWSLADSDRDGMLDEEEFCLAMWVPPLLSPPPAAALAKVFDRVQARRERPALHPTSPPEAALPEVKVSNFWERLVAQTASDRRPGRGSIGSELGSVGGDGEGGSKEGGGGGGGGGGGWHLEDQEPQPPPRKRGGSPGDGWAD